jgi:hypothetical protein
VFRQLHEEHILKTLTVAGLIEYPVSVIRATASSTDLAATPNPTGLVNSVGLIQKELSVVSFIFNGLLRCAVPFSIS